MAEDNGGWQSEITKNALGYQELHDRLARLSIVESPPDGTVQVTLSVTGVLTGLVLRERGRPRPLAQVASEIMDCVRRAQARIPALLEHSLAATVGTHDPAAQLIVADAKTRFPEPPPTPPRPPTVDEMRIDTPPIDPAPPPMPRRIPAGPPVSRPGPTGDADDWDERSLMEDV